MDLLLQLTLKLINVICSIVLSLLILGTARLSSGVSKGSVSAAHWVYRSTSRVDA